jgi:hypothetical protein
VNVTGVGVLYVLLLAGPALAALFLTVVQLRRR